MSFQAFLYSSSSDAGARVGSFSGAELRTLVAQGVAVEPADDTFWFAHALVADAVQHQLLGRERRRP